VTRIDDKGDVDCSALTCIVRRSKKAEKISRMFLLPRYVFAYSSGAACGSSKFEQEESHAGAA
jgi:hypothetical protein